MGRGSRRGHGQVLLPGAVGYAHTLLRSAVQAGDTVVDATMGNGHDTLFLAQQVGAQGRVFAFDVQKQALEKTACRLAENGAQQQVTLMHSCHSRMAQCLPVECRGAVSAVVFNLGYLPGADKTLTTQRETTLAAVDAALVLLRTGGVLMVVVYPGHAEGRLEGELLEQHLAQLNQDAFQVAKYGFVNLRNSPPHVLAVVKTAAAGFCG